MAEAAPTHAQLAIVGGGFSGLGLAVRLKQQDFDDFVVLERADALGGVWRDRTHPGSACDVESHLYAYSFAPDPSWSRSFSPQPEILAYLERCAARYELAPQLRLGHDVLDARWDAARKLWRIRTSRGHFTARVLVGAMGTAREPALPELPGLSRFAGPCFHAARWDHGARLEARRVAVIGTGASAVQLIPALQPRVGRLTVFQRTPAWVVPRTERAQGGSGRRLIAERPLLHRLLRAAIRARRELVGLGLRNPAMLRLLERAAQRHLAASVADPALRAKLTPSFGPGARPILVSDAYLPALAQPNVEVVTAPIREVRPEGIVSDDGVLHQLDAIVLATGARAAELPLAARIVGRDGRSLSAHWAGGPAAHLGSMVAGFPNLFLLLGPGAELGHSAVARIVEQRIELALSALGYLWNQGAAALEPAKEAELSPIDEGLARRLRFRPEDYRFERGTAVHLVPRLAGAQPSSGPEQRSADTQEIA